jgi:hypothetical protein
VTQAPRNEQNLTILNNLLDLDIFFLSMNEFFIRLATPVPPELGHLISPKKARWTDRADDKPSQFVKTR